MAQQSWTNLLNAGIPWQTTQGTTLSTATTATISPQAAGPQDFVLPGQYNGLQWYPGMTLEIEARGVLASGSSASSLTVFLAAGASATLGTTLSTTAAIALGTGSVTAMPWKLKANVNVVNILSSAAAFLETQGELMFETSITPAFGTANTTIAPLPYTAVNGSSLSPWTAATALGLRATLSAAYGSIQCNQFTIKQLC